MIQQAHTPPVARKHPAEAMIAAGPVKNNDAPSGRPSGIKYLSKQIHN